MEVQRLVRSSLIALGSLLMAASAHAQIALRGRLVEHGSTQPISGATVSLRRTGDSTVVASVVARADGTFAFEHPRAGTYTLTTRALGFAPISRLHVVITAGGTTDLGDIEITRVAAELNATAVSAEREQVELAPDRNSYAVKNMATVAGGTAIDVLRNVPSVEVDGTNTVSLRGDQNVVIQINGRPTSLKGEQLGNFLAQLPASTVAKVEVSTNPSARNDADGGVGIINIVLNQETEGGASGGITAATGTTGLGTLTGDAGAQHGPWTLYSSLSLYRDARSVDGTTMRTYSNVPGLAYTNSLLSGTSRPLYRTLTFRSEYQVAPHDALSLDALVTGGRYGRDNAVHYTDLNVERDTLGLFDLFNNQLLHNGSSDFTLAYKRSGIPNATTFDNEIRYTIPRYSLDNLISSDIVQPDASTAAQTAPPEHDVTSLRIPTWMLQSDVSRPFSPGSKLDVGAKETIRTTLSDLDISELDSSSGLYLPDALRSSAFDYRERISAGYGLLTIKTGPFSEQAGVRVEGTTTKLDLPTEAREDRRSYASLFPSALISDDVTGFQQLKVSYSRRITRPDPSMLNPLVQQEDARNVFAGNPDLQPEYTDAVELGYQETHAWGTLQVSPYFRHTTHAIRYVRTVDSTGATLGTFANLASARTEGLDVNVNVHTGSLTTSGGVGTYAYASNAGALSTTATAFTLRANLSYKVTSELDLQGTGNYRARQRIEGGEAIAYTMMNFALRQKLWNDQGSLTVRVVDPFATARYGFITDDGSITELSARRYGQRGVFISINRTFWHQISLRPKDPDPTVPPAATSP